MDSQQGFVAGTGRLPFIAAVRERSRPGQVLPVHFQVVEPRPAKPVFLPADRLTGIVPGVGTQGKVAVCRGVRTGLGTGEMHQVQTLVGHRFIHPVQVHGRLRVGEDPRQRVGQPTVAWRSDLELEEGGR